MREPLNKTIGSIVIGLIGWSIVLPLAWETLRIFYKDWF